MKKRTLRYLLTTSLVVAIPLIAYEGYAFYHVQVDQQTQRETIETVQQISANQSKEEPYLQNQTYLSYVLSMEEDRAKEMDPTIRQVVFDALMTFNKDQMAYAYEMTHFEGAESAAISGKFDKTKGLFYEILQMGNTEFNYYLDGQYVQMSAPEMDPYKEKGEMADLIEPRGIFMDLLIRIQDLKDLTLSEAEQTYQIKGEMSEDLSPYNYGIWTFEFDKTSHQLISYQVEQDKQIIQSIKQVHYTDQADLTAEEIQDLVKSYPNY